jgi:sulfur carrier protein
LDGVISSAALSLVVDGEPMAVAARDLAEALIVLGYADAVVAIALNGDFVPGRKRVATLLGEAIGSRSWRGGGVGRAVAPVGLIRA